MFEKYTEKARRSIFFAWYEARQVGGPNIEAEHPPGLRVGPLPSAARGAGKEPDLVALRERLSSGPSFDETVSPRDLPLTEAAKRVLTHSLDEAGPHQDQHTQIGPFHLLAGLLLEEPCEAASVLREHGVTLARIRQLIAASSSEEGRNYV
jgi:ATP-dependent Clp protease ATP-binding subunit ClpA